MYKFTKTPDTSNQFEISTVEVTMEHNQHTLSELCQEFGYFLRACGFHFKGEVCIEDPDEYLNNEDDK